MKWLGDGRVEQRFTKVEAGWVQVAVAVGGLAVAVGGLAVAVAVLFYTARKDARDARAEMQESIERSVGPRLDALQLDIGRLESKLDKVTDEVCSLAREVAIMYGRQQERDRVPTTDDFASPHASAQESERQH